MPEEDKRVDGYDSARLKSATVAVEVSPVEDGLSRNFETIAIIEKQLEVLDQRLQPISSLQPEREREQDSLGYRGNSSVSEKVASQGYKLSNISERINSIMNKLEV